MNAVIRYHTEKLRRLYPLSVAHLYTHTYASFHFDELF